ncbi:translocation protein TolB [Planctomycetes bacterium CA13]|uniref:Translocation protein TolB n=1 Tax=Novipirellula herctigrandis TaxID=2527986 RepID=A0A5C5YZF7_9BACT|nr:translocation protein TolB [Planctomycetes bacterium CA13]
MQLTSSPSNVILSNANVWSHDGQWIYYDVRSDRSGSVFDGDRIERVHVKTGEVQVVFRSQDGACVGVVTACPTKPQVVFIHGPENPTADWIYNAWNRRGVIVQTDQPNTVNKATNLEARNLIPPFTAGALRGGSHVHTFSPDGKWVSFTYEDQVLAALDADGANAIPHERNQRNIGVSVPDWPNKTGSITVDRTHPRNHDGSHFSVLVTRTVNHPAPGSDQISKAFEEGWVGTNSNGNLPRRAIAFLGQVVAEDGRSISEVFLVDLPDDLTCPGEGPIEGTPTCRPAPPQGVVQRRLTYTADRMYPGIQGPRHWMRSCPDGSSIAFLMKDDAGVVQLWTVSPNGDAANKSAPMQLSENPYGIASSFTWSPDGRSIAHVMDASVCVTDALTGQTTRLTKKADSDTAPRPEACVFSPNGLQIAYVRTIDNRNQIFVCGMTA